MTKEQKNEIVVFEKYDELLSLCNQEHLKICGCQDELKELTRVEIMEEYKLFLIDKKKELTEDEYKTLKESLVYKVPYEILKRTAKICETDNIRCPVEKEEIAETLKIFDRKYDLMDARVFMVLKSVINFQMSAFRMQRYSNYYGVMQEVYDRKGNRHVLLNPVEDAKRRFDESIVMAIEKLDKMIEGNKSVVYGVDVSELIIKAYEQRLEEND